MSEAGFFMSWNTTGHKEGNPSSGSCIHQLSPSLPYNTIYSASLQPILQYFNSAEKFSLKQQYFYDAASQKKNNFIRRNTMILDVDRSSTSGSFQAGRRSGITQQA